MGNMGWKSGWQGPRPKAHGAGAAWAAPPSPGRNTWNLARPWQRVGSGWDSRFLQPKAVHTRSDPQAGHVPGALVALAQGLASHDPAMEGPRAV